MLITRWTKAPNKVWGQEDFLGKATCEWRPINKLSPQAGRGRTDIPGRGRVFTMVCKA